MLRFLGKLVIFFDIILCFIIKPRKQLSLIVIRTDAIGDYLLFRNFLKPIYQKYGRITLVGNQAYQNLVENFDMDYLDTFISIDHKKFIRNPFYRFCVIKQLRKFSYRILINPIYSRDYVSESLARIINADKKIASLGDCSNINQKVKEKYDLLYHKLIPTDSSITFEFYRNLDFIESLITDKCDIKYHLPINKLPKKHLLNKIPHVYSILFIGASAQFRKWSNKNFIDVGIFLSKTFNNHIIICGGKEDFQNGEYIQKELVQEQVNCTNLCGKTSLTELAQVIQNSNYLVSNETSCVHLAVAIGHDKIFVISNGNHFGRFIPYPKELTRGYFPIYHPIIEQNLDAYKIKSKLHQRSKLDINDIKAQTVITAIKQCKL